MSRRHNLWAISFGDLLTLLIFFFVAGFTLNRTELETQHAEDTTITGENQASTSELSSEWANGTLLANNLFMETVDIPHQAKMFGEEEFRQFLKFSTKTIVGSQEHTVKQIKLCFCQASKDIGFEQGMLEAFELRSQLLDVLNLEVAVDIIFDQLWCDQIKAGGQIAFFLEQVSNG